MGNQLKLLSESIATVPAIEKVLRPEGLGYSTEHSGARTRHGFFGASLFTG